jgi:hypothetical protein
LAKYRDRFFQDLQTLTTTLNGDHVEVFYSDLAPIDDDLESQIAGFEKIQFPEGKEKNQRDILKTIDSLKRRLRAYQLYTNANL